VYSGIFYPEENVYSDEMASQLGLLLLPIVVLNLFHLHTEILKTSSEFYLESTPLAYALQFIGGTRFPYSENRELDSLLGRLLHGRRFFHFL
jgi:hypothetical protein